MSEASRELIWMTNLLKAMDFEIAIPSLWNDNMAALELVKNPVHHERAKHIDVKYHFVREKWMAKYFQLNYVKSSENVADIFTKPLARSIFKNIRCKLNIGNCLSSGSVETYDEQPLVHIRK